VVECHFSLEVYSLLEVYVASEYQANILVKLKNYCMFHRVASTTHSRKTADSYIVLVILTDGVIRDMPQTCEAIVKVCSVSFYIHYKNRSIRVLF
jgi:Copine